MKPSSSVYVIKIRENEKMKNKLNDINKSMDHFKQCGPVFDTVYHVKDETPSSNENKLLPDENENHFIMFVVFINKGEIKFQDETMETCDVKRVYLGQAKPEQLSKEDGSNTFDIRYCIYCCITEPSVMANLLDDIDLSSDFGFRSYTKKVKIKSLIDKIEGFLFSTRIKYNHECNCSNLYTTLSESSYTPEKYATQISNRNLAISTSKYRNPFQRDRERIVNSRAFRRLVDKTQIFNAGKGDHYRTRMTHTLEVNQIAKAIALALGLNLDLTEAIALGHDIGHTPFGHQGERTLDEILCNEVKQFNIFKKEENEENDKKDKEDKPSILGGFKHNLQGVRVLTQLEEKYVDHLGLNISMEVLEGILKHTKFKPIYVNFLFDERLVEYLHINEKYSITLEGQTVAIADEIAQRGHDIDDAISSRLISSQEVLEFLEAKNYTELCEQLRQELCSINKKPRIYINEQKLIANRFVSTLIHYFIMDVIEASKKNINKRSTGSNSKIISFSDTGEDVCNYLEKIVAKRVINNSEVSGFDHYGGIIIRKLFSSYFNNPRLLHHGTLRRYYYSVLSHPCPLVSETAIDISDANLKVLNHELKYLIKEKIIYDENTQDVDPYLEKRKILIRCITDYIAGMTDSYAMKEYERLR